MHRLGTLQSCAALAASVLIAMMFDACSTAEAFVYDYELNGSFASSTGGPALVPYGGTLSSTGYYFGQNEGLSLSNVVDANSSYSIDIRFYFDSINASFDGYQRLIDFKNRASDMGLYSLNGFADCFACGGVPELGRLSFNSGEFTDLVVSRDSGGLFTVETYGALRYSFLDLAGNTEFTGPDGIIYFFIDDFESLASHPTQLEAGTGFIDYIKVTSDISPTVAVPEASTWVMLLIGFAGLGLLDVRTMPHRRVAG